jgi:hypothetical protein
MHNGAKNCAKYGQIRRIIYKLIEEIRLKENKVPGERVFIFHQKTGGRRRKYSPASCC